MIARGFRVATSALLGHIWVVVRVLLGQSFVILGVSVWLPGSCEGIPTVSGCKDIILKWLLRWPGCLIGGLFPFGLQ